MRLGNSKQNIYIEWKQLQKYVVGPISNNNKFVNSDCIDCRSFTVYLSTKKHILHK